MVRGLNSILAGLVLGTPAGVAADERWPRWPTEVARLAAPLHGVGAEAANTRQRAAALAALKPFATPAIVPHLLLALDDADTELVSNALALCWERAAQACLPAAASLWTHAAVPRVRLSALKVLSLDPAPSRLAILLSALRDPDPQIRAGAAQFLGRAPLPDRARKNVRQALLAKLGDTTSVVRRSAVQSLGLLGPGAGTLAIARLLDDPDPNVRAAAARALGRHGDPRAIPALLRAAGTPGESELTEGAIKALARLPGPRVDTALLAFLDDPPRGLTSQRVAAAIGRRVEASPALVEGLLDRLDEVSLRKAVLDILLHLGARARAPLQRALDAGLSPPIQLEVNRLLAALEPIPSAPPKASGLRGWRAQIRTGPLDDRLKAARELAAAGDLTPQDLVRALRADDPEDLAPWLIAAELVDAPVTRDPVARARLESMANDPTTPVSLRCLAVARLSRDRSAGSLLRASASNRDRRIRACTAVVLGRVERKPDLLAGLLRDPVPTVRTAAALGLAGAPTLRDALRAPLRLAVAWDPSVAVRRAAHFALQTPPDPTPGLILIRIPHSEPLPASTFLPVTTPQGPRLDIPALGEGRVRFALVPGGATLAKAENRPGTPVPVRTRL